MKTTVRIFAYTIFSFYAFLFSSEAGAVENLEVSPIENSRMIKLETSAPSATTMDIYLLDKRSRALYRETIGMGSDFEKVFDFTGFKDGTYTLVSEMENMRLNRIFEVSGNEVSLKESYYSFIPWFKIEDSRLLVHYINSGIEDINISISTDTGILFDSSYNGDDLVFDKVLSIEDLPTGYYTIELSASGENFAFDFEIN